MRHLAQFNISRLRFPLDDSRIAEFTRNLDRINRLADQSPGFVWRLQNEAGHATDIRPYRDPRIIINLSVWENPEHLRQFTFRTDHTHFMRKRREWFEKLSEATLVMWWVPVGHRPTVEEGKARLYQLQIEGDSPAAFSFRQPFDPLFS